MTAAAPAGRSRVRPAIRRLAIVALVVLVPLAAYRVWDYVELQRLIREIEAIRAKEEPVTVREAVNRAAPPASGRRPAGAYYAAAGAITPLVTSGSYPLEELALVRGWIAGATERPAALLEIADELRRKTAEVHDALALADTGAALPFEGFPAGTAHNAHAQDLAQASLAIATRTVSLSLAGDGDGAVESALSALQFRRGLGSVVFPVMGDHEVAVILSVSRPSVEHLLRLQRALASEDDPDRLVEDLLRTRASYLEQLWRRYYGNDPSSPRTSLLPRPRRRDWPRPWLSRRITHTLRIWADAIDAARTPWPQKREAAEDVRRRYDAERHPAAGPDWLSLPDAVPIVIWWGPAIALEQLRWAAVEVRPAGGGSPYWLGQMIVDRSALVAVAIERYRRDHDGALPDTLDALVPEYLSDVPADPLTGASLRYRVEPDAYTVYSVGADLTDDGGTLLQPAPPGAARRFVPGPDIGVRVLIDH